MSPVEFVIAVGVLWTLIGVCASDAPLFDGEEDSHG